MSLRMLLQGMTLLTFLTLPGVAWGWGKEGHCIVARIATDHLSDKARQGIAELLPQRRIYDSQIALWADSYKFTDEGKHTKPWHFVDIPVQNAADTFKPNRDCRNGNCVITQIEEQKRILADRTASPGERLQALKFVVHLVGDLHQPLHCAERNGDVGGNTVHVSFFGNDSNLHHVWDTDMIQKILGQSTSYLDYAEELSDEITDQQLQSWRQGDPIQWALESHRVAAEVAYDIGDDETPRLYRSYLTKAQPHLERQLKRGGVRLAKVLNDAFQ